MAKRTVTKKVVVGVDLRVQWFGDPDPFFGQKRARGQKDPPSFSGLSMPPALMETVQRLQGVVLSIKPRAYPQGVAAQLRELFVASGRLTNTPNNEEFGPFADPLPTTRGGRWKPLNVDSLAWLVGVRPLRHDGTPDPRAKFKPYETFETMLDGSKLRARFWVAFELQKNGWK